MVFVGFVKRRGNECGFGGGCKYFYEAEQCIYKCRVCSEMHDLLGGLLAGLKTCSVAFVLKLIQGSICLVPMKAQGDESHTCLRVA
jgi:hypothetical protein